MTTATARRTRRRKAKELAVAVFFFAVTVGPPVAYGLGWVRP